MKNKAEVYKQILHLKGKMTAEETKIFEQKDGKKPILGRKEGA